MLCSNDPSWIVDARDCFAVAGIVLLACVMVKTEKDRINKTDSPWIKDARLASFAVSTVVLITAIILNFSVVAQLLLMANLAGLLAINLTALVRRKFPPNSGSRVRNSEMRMDGHRLRHANLRDRHTE